MKLRYMVFVNNYIIDNYLSLLVAFYVFKIKIQFAPKLREQEKDLIFFWDIFNAHLELQFAFFICSTTIFIEVTACWKNPSKICFFLPILIFVQRCVLNFRGIGAIWSLVAFYIFYRLTVVSVILHICNIIM